MIRFELDQATALEEADATLRYDSRRAHEQRPTPFVVEHPAPPISIMAWLAVQSEWPHFYFRNRDRSFEIGAAGLSLPLEVQEGCELSSIHNVIHDIQTHHPQKERLCFLGGNTFFNNGSKGAGWENFPRSGFFLPRKYLVRRDGRVYLGAIETVQKGDTAQSLTARAADSLKRTFLSPPSLPNWEPLGYSARSDFPAYTDWSKLVRTATESIGRSEMRKVVLARRSDLTLTRSMNPYALLQALRGAFVNCYSIMYAPYPGKFLVGASPECLLRIRGDQISSDVLAGTVARGANEKDDEALARTLLASAKMRLEYDYVMEDVTTRLARFGKTHHISAGPELLRLSTVQHLFSVVSAKLQCGVSIFDALRALHPTPAVGGFPREAGLRFIERHELFSRGWYGAPIGVLSHNQAEFAVSIRSALLEGRCLSLFAGCGIVEGSEPQSEWEELESKLQTFLDFFTDERRSQVVGA